MILIMMVFNRKLKKLMHLNLLNQINKINNNKFNKNKMLIILFQNLIIKIKQKEIIS